MGQIIPSKINEVFEDEINSFFDSNTKKSYQMSFFGEKNGKYVENERIIIKWHDGDSFQEIVYRLNANGKLQLKSDRRMVNFNGEFADIIDSKNKQGTEIIRRGNKLYVNCYEDNIIGIEKILTLDNQGKLIHQEHSFIDRGKKTSSYADFSERKESSEKTVKSAVYYKIVNGVKVIAFQSEVTYVVQVDSKDNCHIVTMVSFGHSPGMPKVDPFKETYNKYFGNEGSLVKIEYPNQKKYLTIKYL